MIEAARLQVQHPSWELPVDDASVKISVVTSSTAESGDLVDETDVPVLAGHDARDDLAPCNLGIDDGLASATGHNRSSRRNIACAGSVTRPSGLFCGAASISEKSEASQVINSGKAEIGRRSVTAAPRQAQIGPAGTVSGPLLSQLCAHHAPLPALRARTAALDRKRSIWPLGSVTQISPDPFQLHPVDRLGVEAR